MLEFLFTNMYALFLILLFSIRLLNKKSFQNAETKYFWLTLISCLLLVIQDYLESLASEDPSLINLRITLSILGYTLRSTAALGLLLVIVPRKYRYIYWWIPCAIVLIVNCTAFFTDIAFWFNEEYAFRRGPLGIISFIVPIIYILLILVFSFHRFLEKGLEKFIIPICILFCVVATIRGVLYGGSDLIAAIMTSSVFFYIVLYSHDNRLDPLTGLLNRQAFYDDCNTLHKNIKAVASLDMNGLKELNDNFGHQAGDEALKKIGEILISCTNHKMMAYRIGGDEFVILFYDSNTKIIEVENKIKEKIISKGYSISIGHAINEYDRNIKEMIEESDRMMYQDKANYYETKGIDRRKNQSPLT